MGIKNTPWVCIPLQNQDLTCFLLLISLDKPKGAQKITCDNNFNVHHKFDYEIIIPSISFKHYKTSKLIEQMFEHMCVVLDPTLHNCSSTKPFP